MTWGVTSTLAAHFYRKKNKDRKQEKVILTACPSSSVSASSGVEDEGESEPGSDEEGGFEVFHHHFRGN